MLVISVARVATLVEELEIVTYTGINYMSAYIISANNYLIPDLITPVTWHPLMGNYLILEHSLPLHLPLQLWDTERLDGTITLVHSSSMRQFNWGYTQFSQFNADDTLLLVSGVYLGPHHSSSGEIAVISLGGSLLSFCPPF